MYHRLVSYPPQLRQQSPHLTLADPQFRSCLTLGHLLALRLFQGHQSIPIGLGHVAALRAAIGVQSWTMKIGMTQSIDCVPPGRIQPTPARD
jgi:hypothetical protein